MTDSSISIERHPGGIAVVTMAREPVNSMNLDVWRQLSAALEELEADPAIRGVIWRSGLVKDVFTAGNDLLELYAPKTSLARYEEFWVLQNQFLARLYRSPLVTMAAIRGAAPAGGCCLALCCDYRLMTDFGAIGLNEVALGIPVPAYWAQLMVRTIGQRPAERILGFGVMVEPQEAKALGMVDAVVSRDSLDATASATMAQLLKAPDPGRRATKASLRSEFAQAWADYCTKEVPGSWRLLTAPATIEALGAVLARLGKGKRE